MLTRVPCFFFPRSRSTPFLTYAFACAQSLVVTAAAAFGGSTLAAMFSGRPTPLFTVSSNSMMSYVTLAWYVVHQSALLRKALSLRPVMAVLSFGATAAKVRAMFAFMDDYVREYPRAVAGAIVLGGLSGSGGQLFVSVEQILQNGLDTPSEFSAPGWGFKSAYIAAATYYITVDPEDILYDLGISIVEFDRATARFYIATALCFHAALETLYGTHVNPLFWLDHIFYTVTGLSRGKEAQQPVPERRPKSESAKPGNPDVYSNEVTDSSRPDVMQEGLRKRR